jgi:hypothetical protein
MVRPGVAIAVVEENMVVVYHCMDNARQRYSTPLNPLEFELDDGPAIEVQVLYIQLRAIIDITFI